MYDFVKVRLTSQLSIKPPDYNGSIHISMLTLDLLAARLASYYVFQWIVGLSVSSNLTIIRGRALVKTSATFV